MYKLTLLTGKLITFLGDTEGSIQTGSRDEVLTAFNPVFEKLGTLFSGGINLVAIGATLYFGVKAVLAGMDLASKQNDPQGSKQAKAQLIGNLISAAIAVCLGLIINAVLGFLGIGGIFKVN